MFGIFASLAEFERDLIRERTRAGLSAALARGHVGGRRKVVTPDKLEKARTLIASGLKVREAAARLKIGKTALYEALREGEAAIERKPGKSRTVSPENLHRARSLIAGGFTVREASERLKIGRIALHTAPARIGERRPGSRTDGENVEPSLEPASSRLPMVNAPP